MNITAHSPVELARQVATIIAARAADADQAGALPAADVELLRDSGYLTLDVPREFGGQGLSMRDCMAAHLELSTGSASRAGMMQPPSGDTALEILGRHAIGPLLDDHSR